MVMFLYVYVPDAYDGCSAYARVCACACVCAHVHKCTVPCAPTCRSESAGLSECGILLPAWRFGRLLSQVKLTGTDLCPPPSLSQEDENISGTF